MEAINLKKMMPIAVFVLGISGAFLTTSMQSDAKVDDDPILGYVTVLGAPKPCSVIVQCSEDEGPLCRRSGTTGAQAKAMGPTTCDIEVYRP